MLKLILAAPQNMHGQEIPTDERGWPAGIETWAESAPVAALEGLVARVEKAGMAGAFEAEMLAAYAAIRDAKPRSFLDDIVEILRPLNCSK